MNVKNFSVLVVLEKLLLAVTDFPLCLQLFSQIYFGLLVFVGYMVVDTQDIIEKAHLGDLDYVKHALTLFTDFVAVFVRILIIMVSQARIPDKSFLLIYIIADVGLY